MAQVGRKEKVCVQSPRYQNTVCPNRIRERWKQITTFVINNITSSYSGQSNKEYAYVSKLKGLGWLAASCLGSEHIRKSNAVALKTLCTSPLVFVPWLFAASPIFLTETKYTVKSVLELMAMWRLGWLSYWHHGYSPELLNFYNWSLICIFSVLLTDLNFSMLKRS